MVSAWLVKSVAVSWVAADRPALLSLLLIPQAPKALYSPTLRTSPVVPMVTLAPGVNAVVIPKGRPITVPSTIGV